MPSPAAAIAVNNLQKSYKNTQVLRGVSFTVRPGSIFALLGANGAGKTTTINILTTLLRADAGTASVDGHNVATQGDDVRSRISLTGQFAAVDPVLTARENLVLIAQLRHVADPAATAGGLLKDFDLLDAADRATATFSGGMRRRLDIAMSLIGKPSVVFLDEPTTGLDPQSRNLMWETIRQMAQNGTTVFLTTQYLDEADKLADQIAILSHGKIVAQGTAQELKKMLPGGRIELRFTGAKQLAAARKLFADYDTEADEEAYSLTLTTDGSVKQVARIFAQVEAAKLDVTEFSQQTPTLDDAFLKIINDHKETK
jgi:ABC-2 type transport system ATP-binding protein